MIQYFPIVTGSLTVLGNINVSGSITTSGSITISGSITSASFATSASNATNAISASYANNLTVAGTLTAQTLVVQTITSSVIYSSGSNVFGNNIANTQVMTGSLLVTGSSTFSGSIATTGNITLNKTSPNIFMRGGYTQDLGFFLNSEPAVYIVDDATATKGMKVNISTGAITQLGSGSVSFTGSAIFSSTISAGVITGDSNSTGVPSIVAKVGGGGNNGTYGFGNNSNYRIRGGSDYGAMIFDTNGSERMRINTDGQVLIHSTVYDSAIVGSLFGNEGQLYLTTNGTTNLLLNRLTSHGVMIYFNKDNTTVGYISTNTYSLPSDINFKKNINNIDLGLNFVTKLRPVSYNHKIDDEGAALSTGFIAQELEQSLIELGIKENEYYILQHKPNEDETQSQYWLDYTKMIPVLTKAIQELNTKFEEYKATHP